MTKKDKKKYPIIIILFLLGVVGFIYSIKYSIQKEENFIKNNCPNYAPMEGGFVDRTYFIDCKNNIGIERWDDDDFNTAYRYSIETQDYEKIAEFFEYRFEDSNLIIETFSGKIIRIDTITLQQDEL